jgi:antitoxin (DNA-binding transcriptional repressor) of toxin-antitoxin stability system
MRTVNAEETKIPELLNTTAQGEIVLITQAGSPVAIVSPVSINQSALEIALKTPPKKSKRQRRLGTAKGLITIHEDFDEPLEDFKGYQ